MFNVNASIGFVEVLLFHAIFVGYQDTSHRPNRFDNSATSFLLLICGI